MPSLFAYLIAVGLLLGGGYGALSWLASPEPVKVVAKAKPAPPRPHFDEANREADPEPSVQQAPKPAAETARAETAEAANPPPGAPPAVASAAPTMQSAQAGTDTPPPKQVATPVQSTPTANTKISSAETGPPPERPQAAQPPSPGETGAVLATMAVAKAAQPKRPHRQRLASRYDRHALALMTLRTIEFPDGHRVTQLIPYREDDRD